MLGWKYIVAVVRFKAVDGGCRRGSLLLSFLRRRGPLERRIVEKVVGRGAYPSREAVIGALDNCYDPCCRDRRISVVDMGLIESIEIENREVEIEMVVTTGWCPFVLRLLEMVDRKSVV